MDEEIEEPVYEGDEAEKEYSPWVCNSALQAVEFSCVVHPSFPNGVAEEAEAVSIREIALQAKTNSRDVVGRVVVDGP